MSPAASPAPAAGAVFRRRPDVVLRRVAGETILVPIRGSVAEMDRLLSLNATGAFIWKALDGSRTFADVLGMLTAAFEVAPDAASRDLAEFLEDARAAGVVEAAAP